MGAACGKRTVVSNTEKGVTVSQVGEQTTSVAMPAAKLVTVWGGVLASWGINSWSDVSAILTAVSAAIAALYSLCLLFEWLWRKIVRPFCEYHGWVRRVRRRREDFE